MQNGLSLPALARARRLVSEGSIPLSETTSLLIVRTGRIVTAREGE
jgi:hypothetical protein